MPTPAAPKGIRSRFPGKCVYCKTPIEIGEECVWPVEGRKVSCLECYRIKTGSLPAFGKPRPPAPDIDIERLLAEEAEIERRSEARRLEIERDGAPAPDMDLVAKVAAEATIAAISGLGIAETIADLEAKLAAATEQINTLRPQVTEIKIAGRKPVKLAGRQHAKFAKVLNLCTLGLHPYLVGPPGTGKSTLVENVAEAMGLRFTSLPCEPTMPSSRLVGYMDANGIYRMVPVRDFYENGGVILFDEIDNGHPGITTGMNTALANGYWTFPDGVTVRKHKDCVIVAAGNTAGTGATRQFVGRNQLDAATLDRFVEVEIEIDEQLEEALTLAECPTEAGRRWLATVRAHRANAERHGLLVLFTPRASIEGARMLASGNFSLAETTKMKLHKSLSADVIAKVAA